MNQPPNATGAEALIKPLDSKATDPRFREELDAINWLLEELRRAEPLPVVEAEAVAHSLFVEISMDGRARLDLLPLHDMREYHAVHAVNVSMLSMAMAETLGYDEASIRAIGLAGLLHDIGMVKIPLELIASSEQLQPEERELVKTHVVEGARMIVEADASLDLAAVVAYEHHLRIDGSGYPALSYPRSGHRVSRLVQVCDTFHALSSPRPFRERWPNDVIFSFLQQRAGADFDPEMVSVLVQTVRTAG